jgi:uncharacterized protein
LSLHWQKTIFVFSRGFSSAGRAFEWHSKGQGFDSPNLHLIFAMKIDANINNSVTSDLKEIFQTNLNKIILYGSYARGEESFESDVDYLILTTLSDDEIKEYNKLIVDLSYKYFVKYNVLFSFVIINSNQFTKYSNTLPFYNNIVKEGTLVYA